MYMPVIKKFHFSLLKHKVSTKFKFLANQIFKASSFELMRKSFIRN